MPNYQTISVSPQNGGDLITRASLDNVGPSNYVIKRDWRRVLDAEVRREGDVYFAPNSGGNITNQSYPPGGADPITFVYNARKGNGKTAVIVGTSTHLYRYFEYEDGNVYDETGTVVYATADTVYQNLSGSWITLGTYSAGHRWEAVDVAGLTIFNNGVDLPQYYDLNDFTSHPLYELREQGIAAVDTIASYNGCLFLGGIKTINDENLSGAGYSVSAGDQSIQYQVIWSNLGDPKDFAAAWTGAINTGSNSLTLSRAVKSLNQGDNITITGAGENDGVFTANVMYKVSDTNYILDDNALTTVTAASVQKTSALASISGSAELQDDGSAIVRLIEVQGHLVIFKATSIFTGLATGDAANPFNFQRIYVGTRVPYWRWMLAVVNGTDVIYAGKSSFYSFDLSQRIPREHEKLSLCHDVFFNVATSLSNIDKYYSADNFLTKEIWFAFPNNGTDQILTYDYEFNTCSTIGAAYTAGATVNKPTSGIPSVQEEWFVTGLATGYVLQYAYTNLGSSVWSRCTVNYDSIIKSGLVSFGDDFNVKDLRSLLIYFASTPPAIEVKLWGVRNVQETPVLLMTRTISTPGSRNLIPTFFRKHYYQDQIRVTSSSLNAKLSRKVYEATSIQSKSASRDDNGSS